MRLTVMPRPKRETFTCVQVHPRKRGCAAADYLGTLAAVLALRWVWLLVLGVTLFRHRGEYIAARHLYYIEAFGIRVQCGELAAPYCAGVDGMDPLPICRPSALNGRRRSSDHVRHSREPKTMDTGQLAARRAFVFERDAAARAAIAHASEYIDDGAVAFNPCRRGDHSGLSPYILRSSQ